MLDIKYHFTRDEYDFISQIILCDNLWVTFRLINKEGNKNIELPNTIPNSITKRQLCKYRP